jgi:hypothetical protein
VPACWHLLAMHLIARFRAPQQALQVARMKLALPAAGDIANWGEDQLDQPRRAVARASPVQVELRRRLERDRFLGPIQVVGGCDRPQAGIPSTRYTAEEGSLAAANGGAAAQAIVAAREGCARHRQSTAQSRRALLCLVHPDHGQP